MGKIESHLIMYSLVIILVLMIDSSSQNAFDLIESAVHEPVRIRNQLFTDLHMLNGNLKKLQGNVDNLSSSLNSQTEVMHSLKLQLSLGWNSIDKCEMETLFYGIDIKLIKIKQLIQHVVNDHADKHMDNIDAIMHNVRKSYFDCSMDGQELFVVFQKNISAKLEEFDMKMERLNALEQRLIKSDQEEVKTVEANAALTKVLYEIQNKLKDQEDKLGKLDAFLPLIVNATQSLTAFMETENAVCKKKKCISQKILKLTNEQVTLKP